MKKKVETGYGKKKAKAQNKIKIKAFSCKLTHNKSRQQSELQIAWFIQRNHLLNSCCKADYAEWEEGK